eukprot:5864676-Prymnesium_polylepis.1
MRIALAGYPGTTRAPSRSPCPAQRGPRVPAHRRIHAEQPTSASACRVRHGTALTCAWTAGGGCAPWRRHC